MLKISRESEINLINVLIDNDIISGKDLINIKKVSTEGNKSQIDAVFELKLTDEGIDKRDNIVIENYFNKKIPLCGVLGGGYNKNFDKLVELHAKLHKSCANYF